VLKTADVVAADDDTLKKITYKAETNRILIFQAHLKNLNSWPVHVLLDWDEDHLGRLGLAPTHPEVDAYIEMPTIIDYSTALLRQRDASASAYRSLTF
jgi:hypothetical protein